MERPNREGVTRGEISVPSSCPKSVIKLDRGCCCHHNKAITYVCCRTDCYQANRGYKTSQQEEQDKTLAILDIFLPTISLPSSSIAMLSKIRPPSPTKNSFAAVVKAYDIERFSLEGNQSAPGRS